MRLKCKQINLGGIDLKTDNYNFVIEGLFDHDKSHFESDLYNDGSFISYTKVSSKQMVLNGFVKSSNINDHMTLNRVLASRDFQKLVVDIVDFGEVMLNVKITNKVTDNDHLGKISCQLVAQDPYMYEANPQVLYINQTNGVGVKFPLQFPINFVSGETFERYVDNIGTEIAYPVITIIGTCRDFRIKNVTTNDELVFTGLQLLEGDVLVIDCRPRSRGIYLNGVSRIDLKNGYWISCLKGQNYFTFSRISSSLDNLCTVELQSRWL